MKGIWHEPQIHPQKAAKKLENTKSKKKGPRKWTYLIVTFKKNLKAAQSTSQ
uniref:Uncharacterized protein n=1 Tax=Rhizophora mucronata TaxID=61149 RepID=A0A2P2R4J7_RHIMU